VIDSVSVAPVLRKSPNKWILSRNAVVRHGQFTVSLPSFKGHIHVMCYTPISLSRHRKWKSRKKKEKLFKCYLIYITASSYPHIRILMTSEQHFKTFLSISKKEIRIFAPDVSQSFPKSAFCFLFRKYLNDFNCIIGKVVLLVMDYVIYYTVSSMITKFCF